MQPAAPHHRRTGYSLVELLWVIVILSVVAAFAFPRLDWMRYRLNGEVRNVQMQFAYAQRLAVSLQHDVRVTIDRGNRRLIVDEDANNDGVFDVGERRRVVQLDDAINFERVTAPDLPAPAPTNELTQVVYRRDGSADQAGVVFLNTTRGLNLSSAKDARALQIIRATGRAVSFKFLSGSWVRGS
jgi:prepilin-type N-terminal cleavage/methylation domain-containing protein